MEKKKESKVEKNKWGVRESQRRKTQSEREKWEREKTVKKYKKDKVWLRGVR